MAEQSQSRSELADKLDELIEGIDHMGTGGVESAALSEREWKDLAGKIRTALSERPAITVIRLNDKDVAAPCALDGCALMRGDAKQCERPEQ